MSDDGVAGEPADDVPPRPGPAWSELTPGRWPSEPQPWQFKVLASVLGMVLMVIIGMAIGQWRGAAPFAGAPSPAATGEPPAPVGVSDVRAGLGSSPSTDPTVPARLAGRPQPRQPGVVEPTRSSRGETGGRGEPARPAPPVETRLTAGARIGLSPAARLGDRVRQRDFVARADPIGPSSGAVDRADSTFTARPGLADSRCVSFEAVNLPGFFLRHQYFRLFLQQRREGSWLFDADATFCPVPGLAGAHTSLQSINFPDRYLRLRDDGVFLDPCDGSPATRSAMTFVVRPGLG
ncbi:AbfB domain-containing protein [Plantactinospora siamensis]|uniref:AbfB domain-containing protein n=1 Tax=Plantactinospora siamensis TaxID=555372 RepID=A0ABV6P3V5_9ACTN